MTFSSALRLCASDKAIASVNRARRACFRAGLTRETQSITRHLRAMLAARTGARIVTG